MVRSAGGPTILVVDDEPMVRKLVGRVLEDQGFRVVVAEDGLDALGHLGEDLRLVVTDIEMPHSDGLALASEVRRRYPALPILFISGYGPEANGRPYVEHFLRKPFSTSVLVTRVQQLLGAGAHRS